MSYTILDQYIHRVQNIPSWNIHSISDDGMHANPWFEVTCDQAVRDLVLDEMRLHEQVSTVTGEIQKWGRLSALARRAWEVEERAYRTWRSAYMLQKMDPEEKTKGWKRPTKEQLEAMYRMEPAYHQLQARIERAEEAFHATEVMLEAMRAKKDMLLKFAYRRRDDGLPQLSV